MKTKLTLFIGIFLLLTGIVSAATTVLYDPVASGSGGMVDATNEYIGSGSWKNNDVKFELYIPADAWFGRSVKINEIESIEYHTFKQTTQSGLNFYINLYTKPYEGGSAGWYGDRLTLEPMYSYGFDDAVDEWVKWSTEPDEINQLTVYDQPRAGAYGWYYPPTWQQFISGEMNWNDYLNTAPQTAIDYTEHELLYVVIDTGSAWANGFEGNVDAITITLTDNSSYTIDLEPEEPVNEEVPEFTSIAFIMLAAGLFGFLLWKRRK